MLAFYIDETLAATEESDALRTLISQGRQLEKIEYRRIPCVFPAANEPIPNERLIEIFKGHLHNADVPIGVQSIFIVPKEGIRWAILLQEAFYLVTGFYPITIQQWQISFADDDRSVTRRDYLNMIDMHAVMHDK